MRCIHTRPVIGLLLERAHEHGLRAMIGIGRFHHVHRRYELRRFSTNDAHFRREIAAASSMDGIVLQCDAPWKIEPVRRLQIPAVNVSSRLADTGLVSVIPDDMAIGALAAENLLSRGFRTFASLAMPGTAFSERRCAGFAAAVRRAGGDYLPMPAEVEADPDRRLNGWIRSLPKPVALFGVNDNRASRIANQAMQAGCRVPEEVAVVGVDNDPFDCEMAAIPLSSVDPGFETVGYEAMRLLARMIDGAKPPAAPILIQPRQVVVRASSDTLAVSDPDVSRALRFIRERAGTPIAVPEIARAAGLSRRLLERKFRATLNRSPAEDLRAERLARARHLLAATREPVAAIAERTGFRSAVVFSISFKQHTGVSPQAFRRHAREGDRQATGGKR